MSEPIEPTDQSLPPNVVSIFDGRQVDDNLTITDNDLRGFLRVLAYIQQQSATNEIDIKVDVETVTFTVHTTECPEQSDDDPEDVLTYTSVSHRSIAELYLPMIFQNVTPAERKLYLDMLTGTVELAIASLCVRVDETCT